MKKVVVIAMLALVAVVVPASAKQPKPNRQKPQKCQAHAVAYRVSGTLVRRSLTSNRHARADKGTDKSYTLDQAKVNLHGENPAALTPNSRVKLRGKITTLAKKCDQTGFTATITIKEGGHQAAQAG